MALMVQAPHAEVVPQALPPSSLPMIQQPVAAAVVVAVVLPTVAEAVLSVVVASPVGRYRLCLELFPLDQ